MAPQVTIRATVIEGINGKDEGYPKSVRLTGCGNFEKEFIETLAQEAIDVYFDNHGFDVHGHSPDVYSVNILNPDNFTVPVEWVH